MALLGVICLAVVAWLLGRRSKRADMVSPRVYSNRYSDAAGARRDPPRGEAPGLLDRPFWARVPRSWREE